MRHLLLVVLFCLILTATCEAAGVVQLSRNVSAGNWTHVYNPGRFEQQPPTDGSSYWTWYVNDHTFVYGPDDAWHLFGITHTDPADPEYETNLAHAFTQPNISVNTEQPSNRGGEGFQHAPFALGAKPPETHLWAPYTIFHNGLYWMFYCGGGENRLKSRISLATSRDLWNWTRVGVLFEGGVDGRDPMVLDRGEAFSGSGSRFLIYYTGTDPDTLQNNVQHVHYMRRSDDLLKWSPPSISFVCDVDGHNYGGPCESPFVVQRSSNSYYLFTGTWFNRYRQTHVFHSSDPTDFGSFMGGAANLVGIIHSHAAEVIRDQHGQWWVSRCGWGQLGVYLAPLHFDEPEGNAGTTYPPTPTTRPAPPGNDAKFHTNLQEPWYTTFLTTTMGPIGGDNLNGSTIFNTSSGLAIGDALNETFYISRSPQNSPREKDITSVLKARKLKHSVSRFGCRVRAQLVTKDGNPTSAPPIISRTRFTTSLSVLLSVANVNNYTEIHSLGVNITVNSFNDSATSPIFEMVVFSTVSSSGEIVERKTSPMVIIPFGEQSIPMEVEVESDGSLLRATAFPVAPFYPPSWPGANGTSTQMTIDRGMFSQSSSSDIYAGFSVRQGSALVNDFFCDWK